MTEEVGENRERKIEIRNVLKTKRLHSFHPDARLLLVVGYAKQTFGYHNATFIDCHRGVNLCSSFHKNLPSTCQVTVCLGRFPAPHTERKPRLFTFNAAG